MRELYNCSGGLDNFNACIEWPVLMRNFNWSKNESLNWEVRLRTLEYNVGAAYEGESNSK